MQSIETILRSTKTIAVVGISDKPDRDSGRIAVFLRDRGYDVVGVHPILKEVFGIPVYKSLKDIPHSIDLVDVFMGSQKVGSITSDLLVIKPRFVWYQLGIRNDEEASKLEEDGIQVIQDHCIAVEYRHLIS
ncbi:MAG: CoA-binding protein [Ignavibacteriaceae bacterium]|nr:CoA-binding protein [Ignavibacteriaceae bacterium]